MDFYLETNKNNSKGEVSLVKIKIAKSSVQECRVQVIMHISAIVSSKVGKFWFKGPKGDM
jgi:hypothetical protein